MIKKEILKTIVKLFDNFLNTELHLRLVSENSEKFYKNSYDVKEYDFPAESKIEQDGQEKREGSQEVASKHTDPYSAAPHRGASVPGDSSVTITKHLRDLPLPDRCKGQTTQLFQAYKVQR